MICQTISIKKNLSALLLFTIHVGALIKGQTFIRTYHFGGMNGGLGFSKTSDGGFVGTGQHEGGPAGSCDVYVYRVSPCGNMIWYKTYGSGGSDGGKKVIQASDGGFLVAGVFSNGANWDYMLMKLDAGGNVQWNNVFNMGNADYNVWVEEVPFGIATCGWYYTGSNWEGLVAFYSSSGSLLWANKLIGGGNDQLHSIHFSGGNFWACGVTTSYGTGGDLMVLKLDAAGNLLFANAYGTSANEIRGAWDIEGIPTNDGGYLIAGSTNDAALTAGGWDILLIKINSAGNVIWAKTYGGSGEDIAEGIQKTYDGGFIVVGYTYSYSNGGRDAFLMKIDSVGNMQWAKAYGDAGTDRGIDVANIGKEYVLSANRESSPGSGDYDPMFVKTDSLGNVRNQSGNLCNVVNAPFTVNNVTGNISVSAIPPANYQSVSPSVSFPSPLVGSPAPSENFICISCAPSTPSINVTPTVVCEGQPITLSNLSNINTAACFEWLGNGSPLNVSGYGTQTVTLPAGTYNIELKATCGNTISSTSQLVIVNPKPTAAFSYTDHICIDKQPVDYINTGNSGGGYSQVWYLGNGATPSTTTSVNATGIVYSSGGSKNVSLVVTNVYGCKDSITKTINIEPLPNLVFSANSPTCINDTTYFTNYSWVGGTGVISNWYWDFGDGNNSNLCQPKHTYTVSGTYTVMLVATSDYGCDDTLYQLVNISPLTIPGSVTPNATVCATSNNGTLNVVGNNGNVVQWEYSQDGGINWFAVSNITSSQTYSNLPTTTIYRALIKSGNCPAAYTSPNATITVNAPSYAGILLKDTAVCAGSNNGTLTVNNYTGTIQDWYISTNNGATWTGLGNTSYTYAFNNLSTTSWYQVIVQNGVCPADTSNIVKINVSPNTVGGTISPNYTLCASSNSGTLTINGYTGNIIGWQYSNDGGATFIPINNTTSVQTFTNLLTTTIYNAFVQSGVCPVVVVSNTVFIDQVTNPGTLIQDMVVCKEANTGTLSLLNHNGTILDWYSIDKNNNWLALSNTTNNYVFSNLLDTTKFAVIVQNGVCPADTSNIVTIYVNKFNNASITPYPDTTISLGYSVQIIASGGTTYLWSPYYNISDTTINNPFVWPSKDTSYVVYVKDLYGCLDTATVKIFVRKDYKLIIANTMTPNGDGYNDYFWIGMIEHYPNNEVMVFNHYGQMIFKGTNYDNKKVFWDGTYQGNKVPDGAYYYVIKFTDSQVVFKGSISVISSR